jgi:hypothetical protein
MAKVNEYLMHYRNIVNIMKRHKKILVYALPGEGKTTLLRAIKEKFEPDGWNFYDFGVNEELKVPYIYELPHAFLPQYAGIELPTDFDLIYVIQYSREYKEDLTGVSFGDEYRPMSDYVKRMKYNQAHKNNLGGKRFKTIADLQAALQGE